MRIFEISNLKSAIPFALFASLCLGEKPPVRQDAKPPGMQRAAARSKVARNGKPL
jgi:hypothetical protein